MIEFYIINLDKASDFKYYTVNSIICREEEIKEGFSYDFRYCKGYLKKYISKNFAGLAFKSPNHNIYSINTKNRVPIKELVDNSYSHLFSAREDIDLHHSIRKV